MVEKIIRSLKNKKGGCSGSKFNVNKVSFNAWLHPAPKFPG
jgi:hypothetical protein